MEGTFNRLRTACHEHAPEGIFRVGFSPCLYRGFHNDARDSSRVPSSFPMPGSVLSPPWTLSQLRRVLRG